MISLPLRLRRPALHSLSFGRLVQSIAARQQRQRLRDLDAHLLKDIGISHAEALAEADRPFWDAPASWKR